MAPRSSHVETATPPRTVGPKVSGRLRRLAERFVRAKGRYDLAAGNPEAADALWSAIESYAKAESEFAVFAVALARREPPTPGREDDWEPVGVRVDGDLFFVLPGDAAGFRTLCVKHARDAELVVA